MIVTVGTHNLRLYDDERRSFAPLSNRICKTKTVRLILLKIDLHFGGFTCVWPKQNFLLWPSTIALLVASSWWSPELEYARPSSTEHLPTNTPETSTSTLAHHNALLPSRFREGILQRSTHRFTVRLFPPKWGFSSTTLFSHSLVDWFC